MIERIQQSLFIFVLLLISCQPQKKLEENLGDKVSSEDYQKAIVSSWGTVDFNDIHKDDFAYIEKSISISNGAFSKILGKGMTVTEIEDTSDSTKYHLVIQSEEPGTNNQPSKFSSRERVLEVAKEKPNEKLKDSQQSLKSFSLEDEIQVTPFENFSTMIDLCSIKNIECYKLKIEDFYEEVPTEIKNNQCRFFTDCRWRGKKVSVVIRVSSENPDTHQIETQNNIITLKIVDNLPFLFKMVEYCFEGLSEYQNQKFPLKICTTLKDAIRGN